jgi:hypothetical protein
MKHFTVPEFTISEHTLDLPQVDLERYASSERERRRHACGTVTESLYTVHAVQLLNYYIFTCVHMQVSDLLKRLIY